MQKRSSKTLFILLLIGAYVVGIALMSSGANAEFGRVFIGTSSLFMNIFLLLFLPIAIVANPLFMALYPLLTPLIFYYIWYSNQFPYLATMDGLPLTIFCLIFSYLAVLLVGFPGRQGNAQTLPNYPRSAAGANGPGMTHSYHALAGKMNYKQRMQPPHPLQQSVHHANIPANHEMQFYQKHASQQQNRMQRNMHDQPEQIQKQHYEQQKSMHEQLQQQHHLQQNQMRHQSHQIQSQLKENQELQSQQTQQQEYHQHYTHRINKLKDEMEKLRRKPEVTKETFSINIKSIEDKCKAINFVIGRVYSDKKGGSAQIREKLNIDRELYNAFSELSADGMQQEREMLHKILTAIYHKLQQMELPEKSVFKLEKAKLQLKRENDGKEKILEILAANDKDPIKEYHSEAKNICTNLLRFLEKG